MLLKEYDITGICGRYHAQAFRAANAGDRQSISCTEYWRIFRARTTTNDKFSI